MRALIDYLRHRRDAALLAAAFVLLLAALFRPTVPVQRNIYSYVLVADISQSMNTRDATLNGKTVTREEYTRYLMQEAVSALPCGTRVSIALFAGVSVTPLYTPIEVCANYAAIKDTIDHLDWRMAWSGNSRIRESMLSTASLLRALPEPAQIVFFTDGEEAPRLHAFNTRDLTGFQGGNGWLLVGVGSDKGTPIPKLDEKNQLIGYWAGDSFAMQPGIAQISEQNIGARDDNVAGGESDRYLSKLDEEYLKSLAKEVSATYIRGDSALKVITAMQDQKPARRDRAPLELNSLLAGLAALLLLAAHVPQHPKHLLQALRRRFQRPARAA
jgi:mxaL protein